MAKKRAPAKETKATPPKNTPAAGSDLSSAVKSLQEAAQSLAATAAQMAQMMQHLAGHGSGAAPTPLAEPSSPAANAARAEDGPANGSTATTNEEASRFYERLEQTGQLVDANDTTDLSALPPQVTHIRRPDGTIERIGFSTSPYTKK